MELRNAISLARAEALYVRGLVNVACLSTDVIGAPLVIRDEPINGKYRVRTADPSDISRMPAIGILVSKTTPTVGTMRVSGICDVFSGLTPGADYMVGLEGNLVEEVPGASVSGVLWAQHIGVAMSSNVLLLSGNVAMIGYNR